VTQDDGAASLDLAIDWLGRRIADLASTPAAGRGSVAGSAVPTSPSSGVSSAHPPATASSSSPSSFVSSASAASSASASGTPSASTVPGAAGSAAPAPAQTHATPLLDQAGRDLTALAAQGLLAPAIGRDSETARLVEALCRPTRPSAVLLGPDGIGKAAIVEGLAARITAGAVPPPLRGCRIVELPLSALVAGTQYRGQLEERLAQLVREASQPGIVLFIEGLDQLAKVGRTDGGLGALESLRDPIARGDVRVVGTARADEFRDAAEATGLDELFTAIPVSELDVAATRPIVLAVRDRLATAHGVRVTDEAVDVLLAFADASLPGRRFPDKAIDLLSSAIAAALVDGRTEVDGDAARRLAADIEGRGATLPTLERVGRDLVALARAGRLGPIQGRDREIEAIAGVLLRRTKRNPALVGPAGAGKTAIVEGFAIRIAEGRVPQGLKDFRVFDVPLLGLAAAAETSARVVEDLLAEARHPSVVLFFDEIHTLALPAVRDLSERLKPPLARGEIAVIGATTSEEYQQLIEPLSALARRFTLVPVEPMDDAAVQVVLDAVRVNLAKLRGVTVSDDALAELVDLADRFLPNRSEPDKGVDLVEQSVTWALTHGETVVDVETAREAVASLVGMPLDPAAALGAVETALRGRRLLDDEAVNALIGRLRVSLRGLDATRERPDAVILLRGEAAAAAGSIADLLASQLFGRATARIDIDLSGLTEDASISSLLGSAPGLIGSDRTLPLHDLRRSPWQVVTFTGIEGCAASIRATIAAALHAGRFTDAMGRSIPLGAAIVLLTAPSLDGGLPEAVLAAALSPDLLSACDAAAGSGGIPVADREAWVGTELLAGLAGRLARAGYPTTFGPGLAPWVAAHLPTDGTAPERWLDQAVTAVVVGSLPATPGPVIVDAGDAGPTVRPAGG